LGQYQTQAEYEKQIIDTEAERVKEAEGDNQEKTREPLYRDIMPRARERDAKEMLNITQKLEEIRLKESPTDIGQLSKKRKAE
jgi:hypothetical protein